MRLGLVAMIAASVAVTSVACAVVVTSAPSDQAGVRLEEPAISVAAPTGSIAPAAVPDAPVAPAPAAPGVVRSPVVPAAPEAATPAAPASPAGAQPVPPAPAKPVGPGAGGDGDHGKHTGAGRGAQPGRGDH